MMLEADRYYRQYGIVQPTQFIKPKLIPIELISLPKNAILHYIPEVETESGPMADNLILRSAVKQIYIQHCTELLNKEGAPKTTGESINQLIDRHSRVNKRFRQVQREKGGAGVQLEVGSKEPTNLVIENYGLLPSLYRYNRTSLTTYYIWKNIWFTMCKRIVNMIDRTGRDQYIYIQAPTVLPKYMDLNHLQSSITADHLKPFEYKESLAIFDLFEWLGAHRELSGLSSIPTDHLDKVNVVLRIFGRWTVFNLGRLNSWRSADGNKGTIQPVDFQVKFALMIHDMQARTLALAAKEDSDSGSEIHEEETVDDDEEIRKQLDDVSAPVDEEVMKDLTAVDELAIPEDDSTSDVGGEMTDEDGNLIMVDEKSVLSAKSDYVYSETRDHETAILKKAEQLAVQGLLTGAEYRRAQKLAETYKSLPNPYTGDGSFEQAMTIKQEQLILDKKPRNNDSARTFDKSMLSSTAGELTAQYVEHILPKDILQCVMAVQQAGIAVVGYDVDRHVDAISDYETHTVKLAPINGKAGKPLVFRIPKVDKYGTFIASGTKYRTRIQKADVPIRKVSPIRVGMTSYYSKIFVERSSKAVFDYGRWVCNALIASGHHHDGVIENLLESSVESTTDKLPFVYSSISTRIKSFDANGIEYWFDYRNRISLDSPFTEEDIKTEKKGLTLVGKGKGKLVYIDDEDTFYAVDKKGSSELLGRAEDVFKIHSEKIPVPISELIVLGKAIPMGIILGYLLGLDNLLAKLKVKPRIVPNGSKLNLQSDEYAVRFLDETYIFSREDQVATLILAGFNAYKNDIRNYSSHSFNSKDVYEVILERNGLNQRYTREIALLDAMWVDPITKNILEWMGEPTTFVPLLFRATEMLKDRYVPDRIHSKNGFVEGVERLRGYERIAGAVYTELVKSVREYNRRSAITSSNISMNPLSVWINILSDPATAPTEELNPVHNLKEKAVVTYGGTGGRSRRSMVADTRTYQKGDEGIISEGTVDSGDVAIITYLSPSANITTLRGTTRMLKKDDGNACRLSAPALLAVASDRDDPKRVNFTGIQQSHRVSTVGYRSMPLRTGYDEHIAHMVDPMFAVSARIDGKVKEVTDKHIVVEYKDGTEERVQLGRIYGSAGGLTVPHQLVTTFAVGDTVKRNDIIAYNNGHFEPIPGDKRHVTWRMGVLARTVLMESVYTLEDSTGISDRLASKLITQATKVKDIVVQFNQEIRNMVKPGDKVDLTSPLCYIEDAVTAKAGLFDSDSIDTLRLLSAQTPVAKCIGVVEKIEVFYHGDFEDMSESLQSLAYDSDRERRRRARQLGTPEVTGQVDNSYRIEGNGLELDQVAIRVYITYNVPTGIGDKLVYCNQMKTVIGTRFVGVHETETGETIDAIFGNESCQARIVLSPYIIGTTNTLLRVIGENAADIFFNELG